MVLGDPDAVLECEGVDESDDVTLEEGVEDDDSDGVPLCDDEPDTDAVADTLLEKDADCDWLGDTLADWDGELDEDPVVEGVGEHSCFCACIRTPPQLGRMLEVAHPVVEDKGQSGTPVPFDGTSWNFML